MYETQKLKEATHDYSEMMKNKGSPTDFEYSLSAFLSSSRSVLQYAYAELRENKYPRKWYDEYISKHPIIKFFGNKRDINIHFSPVKALVGLNYCGSFRFSIKGYLENSKGEINLAENNSTKENKGSNDSKEAKFIGYTYTFDDWPGTEDVLSLCEKYLKELIAFILEAKNKGYITG